MKTIIYGVFVMHILVPIFIYIFFIKRILFSWFFNWICSNLTKIFDLNFKVWWPEWQRTSFVYKCIILKRNNNLYYISSHSSCWCLEYIYLTFGLPCVRHNAKTFPCMVLLNSTLKNCELIWRLMKFNNWQYIIRKD